VKPAAILFDFDGTLAPNLDLPDMRKQVIELTAQFAVPEEVYADHYIVEIINVARDWIASARNLELAQSYFRDAHQRIIDIEMHAASTTQPFPGIRTLLKTLQSNNIRMGVVTRNCRAAVLQVFPDLLEHVDVLHARDDVTYLKPDKRHLEMCLDALGVHAHQAAMVGDGALDMQAGLALEMHCIGVLTGSADRSHLQAAGAHQILPSCLELDL